MDELANRLANFALKHLGDEFCLNCYKTELGLTDQKEAEGARASLVVTGRFKVDQGTCKKCQRTGLVMKSVEKA